MEIREVLSRLREPFPPEDHTDRDLPGGGKWFYVTWQKVRERLDAVYPEWQVEYGTPIYLDKYCAVSCTLSIAGISRQAWGNAEIELLSKSGKDMSRGSGIERAIADSFRNAAESFGVAAYLDEQSQDKREFTIRYLSGKGDSRGLQAGRSNGWVAGNLPDTAQKKAMAAAESEARRVGVSPRPQRSTEPTTIATPSPLQERFNKIRKCTGHTWAQITAITAGLFKRDTKAEPLERWEADQLRNDLLIDRAIAMSFTKDEASTILGRVLANNDSDDELICGEFLRLAGETLAAKETALATVPA